MKKIKLALTSKGWMSETFGPEREEIISLFGTATLPTAFTAQANESYVVAQIQNLNPGYIIEVA